MSHFLPPLNLPDGIILLITDELPSPADFLLHRTLSAHLKRPIRRHEPLQGERRNKTRAIILSVSEDLGRWRVLASRTNINLQNHLDSGTVLFVDLLAGLQTENYKLLHPENGLRMAFERVRQNLSSDPENSNTTLLILDDISSLEWMGVPSAEVQRFVRALRALCLKTKTTLLVRHHLVATAEADPDDLFRLLLQISEYHLEVRPLSSGRSGEVTGEISLHRGFSALSEPDSVKLINRSSALQFKLTDAGPEFFAKGTSAGVL